MSLLSVTAADAGRGTDHPPPRPATRVFCLAHAGGSTAHFRAWRWLDPFARVVPLELPGRGTRMGEPHEPDWEALVGGLTETVAAEVGPRPADPASADAPYVLFGHSLGALLAFDISHRMLERGRPPALLAVAGRNGPSLPASQCPVHRLADREFVGALHALGGLPTALTRQPELMRLFLPMIRRDLRLAEQYARPDVPRLPIPVVAFAGRQDPMTDAAGVLAWAHETTSVCELVFLEGEHFFLASGEFERQFAERIARLAGVAPRRQRGLAAQSSV
ncbi:thioesterase II family protein [Actinoplanes sp. NPDC049681]|uniref:thioesterase II family protein n=1 Tax=Actinoplanes sp. NPDC049681 TaxID=3363905 RepID=UPI0037B5D988